MSVLVKNETCVFVLKKADNMKRLWNISVWFCVKVLRSFFSTEAFT